jgi:hypothetical protein
MNWTGLFYYFLSITGLSGLCYFVIKKIIDSSVEVGLIKYKSELDKDLQSHKLQLDKMYVEHQIKFNQLHTGRLDSIKKIHNQLYEIESSLYNITTFFEEGKVNIQTDELTNDIHKLRDLIEINRIYFDEDLCIKIELVIEMILENKFQLLISNNEQRLILKRLTEGEIIENEISDSIGKWIKLNKGIREKIRGIRLEMTKEFRTLIGVS